MKRILMIDNYDSFTYNLVHIVEKYGYSMDVYRNDKISLKEVAKYEKILLSPGPGVPNEAGILVEIIKEFGSSKDIFGICLGHQAIAETFGGVLFNMKKVMHGIALKTLVTVESDVIFKDIPSEFDSGRYHSWAVKKENLPENMEITAVDEEGIIMAIKHKYYEVRGVQFHPESILTEFGDYMIRNWLEN